MSGTQPGFMGEIMSVSFNFAPQGYAMCNGQLLPINQNQALFSLLGTTYGGDGRVNFALPDLRGRVPMHQGSGHTLGERAGQEFHTLTSSEMPQHNHPVNGTTETGTTPVPTNHLLADSPSQLYASPNSLTPLDPSAVTTTGGSQPHENRQPYLVLNFCIALQGIFPSPN